MCPDAKNNGGELNHWATPLHAPACFSCDMYLMAVDIQPYVCQLAGCILRLRAIIFALSSRHLHGVLLSGLFPFMKVYP